MVGSRKRVSSCASICWYRQRGLVMAAEAGAPYRCPSVATPVAVMQALSGVLAEGYDGDAVADTEALYDGD